MNIWTLEEALKWADTFGAVKWPDEALGGNEMALDVLARTVRLQSAALADMLSGWRYIRQAHGDLYGVGWDRAQRKAEAALGIQAGEEIPAQAFEGTE